MTGFASLPADEQTARLAALGHAALSHWPFGPCELRAIKVRENAVFEARTQGGARYALRVHRAGYHTDAELEAELAWMRMLESRGFAVPVIVPDRDGRLFRSVAHADVPGARQVDVFEWIEGRQLGNVEGSLDGDPAELAGTFRTVGRLAARLHDLSTAWTPPPGFTRHAWDDAGLVGEHPFWGRFWELAALKSAERTLLVRARDRLRVELGALPRTPDVYGLIHADFAPENLLVDGERVRLLDFDDAGYGWHAFELATSLYFHYGQPCYSSIRDAVVAGYREERTLTDEWLARLPLFLAARSTTYLGWVHTRPETETARELTPMLVELCCTVVGDWLDAVD
jgi:Ser/Thr protein kinase RdoA (MazF antagonist)